MTLEMKLNESRYEGEQYGIAIGEARGIQQKAVETAKKLFTMNVLTETQIAIATGLSLQEVQTLQKDIL